MSYLFLCLFVFSITYLINIFYVSVLYHRGLTHNAVQLRPWARKLVIHTGSWVTGLDPKGWSCMHRMHHLFSDTPKDPHSPLNFGVIGTAMGQLKSYQTVLIGLIRNKKEYVQYVKDLNFPVSILNRKRLWALPYLLHFGIALGIGFFFNAWLLGGCYWLGMMSHPVQGWMVNALAHRFGYRNYDTDDNSRNNTFVAWFVFGEGFQNNHHKYPNSVRFSVRWFEIDPGFLLCRIARRFGMLDYQLETHTL